MGYTVSMLRKSCLVLISATLMFTSACGGSKKTPSAAEQQTPNIRIFPAPFQTVWKATLETAEFDFLMGIEMQEIKRGVFSTELVRDYQPFQKRRFRVSGTLIFDGQGTIVKLYKHEEIMVDNEWKAIPSDSRLENQILQKISQKLQPRK